MVAILFDIVNDFHSQIELRIISTLQLSIESKDSSRATKIYQY